MPRKNGFEVLPELKADPGLRSIPVIIFTSSVTKEDIKPPLIVMRMDISKSRLILMKKDFWFSISILYDSINAE